MHTFTHNSPVEVSVNHNFSTERGHVGLERGPACFFSSSLGHASFMHRKCIQGMNEEKGEREGRIENTSHVK